MQQDGSNHQISNISMLPVQYQGVSGQRSMQDPNFYNRGPQQQGMPQVIQQGMQQMSQNMQPNMPNMQNMQQNIPQNMQQGMQQGIPGQTYLMPVNNMYNSQQGQFQHPQ